MFLAFCFHGLLQRIKKPLCAFLSFFHPINRWLTSSCLISLDRSERAGKLMVYIFYSHFLAHSSNEFFNPAKSSGLILTISLISTGIFSSGCTYVKASLFPCLLSFGCIFFRTIFPSFRLVFFDTLLNI